jgi:hypothetical protein
MPHMDLNRGIRIRDNGPWRYVLNYGPEAVDISAIAGRAALRLGARMLPSCGVALFRRPVCGKRLNPDVADLRVARLNHADGPRRRFGKINNPAPDERAAVIDAHNDALAVRLVDDLDSRAEWQAFVRGDGFIRSPFAVMECSAYQDARPHSAALAPERERNDAASAPKKAVLIFK